MKARIKQHLRVVKKQDDVPWLNDALSLRYGLMLLDEDKPAADELLLEIVQPTRKRDWEEKQHTCYMVCANLIHARYARKPLVVSMNRNAWAGKLFVYDFISLLIEHK
ncbi:MAG: hypothetical protein ABSH41_12695, partial [Syntrophobacteraceae bacterium]